MPAGEREMVARVQPAMIRVAELRKGTVLYHGTKIGDVADNATGLVAVYPRVLAGAEGRLQANTKSLARQCPDALQINFIANATIGSTTQLHEAVTPLVVDSRVGSGPFLEFSKMKSGDYRHDGSRGFYRRP
jgi:hypothetical protein